MRRNRKNNIRRERIIMIASSAFVLAALTMTGVYMKERNVESKDDGYSVDFTALEQNVDDKFQEIAQNNTTQEKTDVAQNDSVLNTGVESGNMDDDLDYMPLEVGSGLVEIPGLTDGMYTLDQENMADLDREEEDVSRIEDSDANAEAAEEEEDEEASSQKSVVSETLHFAEEEGLVRPTAGEILMHYSMDGSIYFETLDQYKYNPAVIFSAEDGSAVSACAEGKVVDIYEDAQIGHAVTIDLGSGYQATYGQLKDIQVTVDSYVDAGETIGSVAAPTKYFSVEGSNLYFQLTKDGTPVNPENLF